MEESSNGLAIIKIDRPKALNAVNIKMCKELQEVVAKCQASSTVKAVLFQGAGEKGFSSGGDVKALHPLLKEDICTQVPKDQIYNEYHAIFAMRQLTCPTVSFMHGITMGCGLALACSATYAVATEKTRLAMPENNIGLFPDAGFSYLAAKKMPRGLGRLMALTGVHLVGAGDAMASKLATHHASFETLPELLAALKAVDLSCDPDVALRRCLEEHTSSAAVPKLLTDVALELSGQLAAAQSLPDACGILEKQAQAGNSWATELMASMRKGAPFSQAVAFRLLELAEADAAAGLADSRQLKAALDRDFLAASRVMYRQDFLEGLRAVLVDKDMSAKWQPASIAELSADELQSALAPAGESEAALGLPLLTSSESASGGYCEKPPC